MKKTILYIAMSLDGFVADAGGGVDWLEEYGGEDDGYADFLAEVDTVVMGWNTYRQITEELSPTEWVYQGLSCWVVTHRRLPLKEGIFFTQEDPGSLVRRLKAEPGKGIWICGGAHVAQQLVREGLVDEYRLFVLPVLLGSGLRLFGEGAAQRLELVEARRCGQMAALCFRPAAPKARA